MKTNNQKSIQKKITEAIKVQVLELDLQELIKKVDKDYRWNYNYTISKWYEYERNLLNMEFEKFINLTLILLTDNTARGVAEEELTPLTFKQKQIIHFQFRRTEVVLIEAIRSEYNNGLKKLKERKLERITKEREQLGRFLGKDIEQVQQEIINAKSAMDIKETDDEISQQLKTMLTSLEAKVDNLHRDFETSSSENNVKILDEIKQLSDEFKEELNKPSLSKDLRAATVGVVLGQIVKVLLNN